MKRNSNREPVCAECVRKARVSEYSNGYLAARSPKKEPESTVVDAEEPTLSIVTHAMSRLEAMLKAVDSSRSRV